MDLKAKVELTIKTEGDTLTESTFTEEYYKLTKLLEDNGYHNVEIVSLSPAPPPRPINHRCIFEHRDCEFARNTGTSFECTAPNVDYMTCGR
jgi:hypothetical protein